MIGLAMRIALMPFTMHTQDLVYIYYFPMLAVRDGIWDVYGIIASNFSCHPYTYYGPVLLAIISGFLYAVMKIFNPVSLITLLDIAGPMLFKNLSTADFVNAFAAHDLFRNLFLMKSIYLIFDFLIAAILLKTAKPPKQAASSYKIWMLNIVVLYSTYAIGGFDIITAFFVCAALYAAMKNRPHLAIILLSLGGATKLFPYILILPAALLLGDSWRKRIYLIAEGAVVSILPYVPFYLSSGSEVLKIFMLPGVVEYPAAVKWSFAGLFLILYSFVCVSAVKDSTNRSKHDALYYFLIVLLLLSATFPTRLRYFVILTPLLALIIPRCKKIGYLVLFIIFMLFFSHSAAKDQQLGLFAPINPVFFLSLPTLQEAVRPFIDVNMVYRLLARLSPLIFFTSAFWIWRIKSDYRNPEEIS